MTDRQNIAAALVRLEKENRALRRMIAKVVSTKPGWRSLALLVMELARSYNRLLARQRKGKSK